MNAATAAPADLDTVGFQAALLDSVGQAVVATDTGGTVIYWNSAAERLYGWTAQEAVGRSVVELTPAPQSVEEATQIFAELAAGRSWEGEFVVRHRDGTAFPAHVTDTPVFGADGTLQAIIGISTDITERKRAEQAVRHPVGDRRVEQRRDHRQGAGRNDRQLEQRGREVVRLFRR